MGEKRCLYLLSISAFLLLSMNFTEGNNVMAGPSLKVSLAVNSDSFTLREAVNVYGNLTLDDNLVQPGGLVSIEVVDSTNSPMVYRTIKVGNPQLNPSVDMVAISPCNASTGEPKQSFETDEIAGFNLTVQSFASEDLERVVLAINVYDGNYISLYAAQAGIPLARGSSGGVIFGFQIGVETPWAYIGGARVVANVFSDSPKDGGVAYCLEKSATFNITRGPGTIDSNAPNLDITSPPGLYNASFKLSPESRNGTYAVYATGEYGVMATKQSTAFQVQSVGVPPQASFTYIPAQPFVNQTVEFDASASSGEGYHDSIVQYAWDFGDGHTYVSPLPAASNSYNSTGRKYVTLNVTDTEGLWCITVKPIDIQPPVGPTADFDWYQIENRTVSFDGSKSKRGWNGTGAPPIVRYSWDFGDGNITTALGYPGMLHVYTLSGNYTVTLNVTDAQGSLGSKSENVTASDIEIRPYDINGDRFVNIKDAVLLGAAFSAQKITDPASPRYGQYWRGNEGPFNPRNDITGDGYINIKDAVILGTHFGEHY